MKYMKVSYEDIKGWVTYLCCFLFTWLIVDRYYEKIIDIKLTDIAWVVGTTRLSLTLSLFLSFGIMFLIYALAKLSVNFFYNITTKSNPNGRRSGWYNELTEYYIKVPLTKGMYKQIKDNHFLSKDEGYSKPTFSYRSLQDWADNIINKELKKLIKGDDKK